MKDAQGRSRKKTVGTMAKQRARVESKSHQQEVASRPRLPPPERMDRQREME